MTQCKFLEVLPEDVSKTFKDAKTNLVLASNVVSYLLYSCGIYFTNDNIPHNTAFARITPKENQIVIHVDFWRKQTPQVQTFVLYHEILHIFLEHSFRMMERGYKQSVFGRAADYNINAIAKGFSKDGTGRLLIDTKLQKYLSVPDWCLYEENFIGKSADEIYYILLEKDNNDDKGGGNNGNGDSFDELTYPESATKDIREANIRSLQGAAIAASMNSGIGSSDANLVKIIEQMTKVEIPWHQYIQTVITRAKTSGLTYNRYNSRSDDIIFPARNETDSIRIVYGVDTSGSMSQDDYSDCAGVLFNICSTYDSYEVILVSCDTTAHVIGTYTDEDGIDFSKMDLSLIGGGGTAMLPIIKYANNVHYDEPVDAVIVGTDGHIPVPEIENYPTEFPKIFVVTNSGNKKLKIRGSETIHVN